MHAHYRYIFFLKVNGCWSFAGMTDSDRNKIDAVLKADVIPYIIKEFLDTDDESRITPAVKTVGNIMAETDEQVRQKQHLKGY